MSIFKKALGVFVDFEEEKKAQAAAQPAGPEGAPAGEAGAAEAGPAQVQLPDQPADLTQDPDVARVMQAGQLLASLPLADIPVEKARELVARTLEFAGMKPAELLASFQRAQELYQAQIGTEQGKIEERRAKHTERMEILQAAIAEEKQQFEAELQARTARIESAHGGLGEIAKAMAFFTPATDGPEEPQKG